MTLQQLFSEIDKAAQNGATSEKKEELRVQMQSWLGSVSQAFYEAMADRWLMIK